MVEVSTQATVILRDQSETEYAVVKFADMSEKMQQHAVDCASYAFKEKRILDDIAQILKTEFDTMYNPTWNCIVGRGFGSYVTHQSKNFIFFYWGEVGVLLWKTES
jgi:dynein light chain LC8-type